MQVARMGNGILEGQNNRTSVNRGLRTEPRGKVSIVNRDELVARVLELKQEIEELERDGREYVAMKNPSPFQRDLQDRRIVRLEEIKCEIEKLAARHIQ
jgi:hypothetical protein